MTAPTIVCSRPKTCVSQSALTTPAALPRSMIWAASGWSWARICLIARMAHAGGRGHAKHLSYSVAERNVSPWRQAGSRMRNRVSAPVRRRCAIALGCPLRPDSFGIECLHESLPVVLDGLIG
jgi:hypothetical protein